MNDKVIKPFQLYCIAHEFIVFSFMKQWKVPGGFEGNGEN